MKESLYTITNQILTATFSADGAELQSLRDADGREYNWQGIAPYWQGRGPILFPATGAPWDETYLYQGKAYRMPKHGFAKRQLFSVEKHESDAITFVLLPNDETREFYPFNYELRVSYRLVAHQLAAHFEVKNLEADTLYFQIGGHPALAIPQFDLTRPVNGYVRFLTDQPLDALYLVRAREQGCIQPGQFPVPFDADGLVPLKVETFANEALIFEKHQIRGVELLDMQQQRVVVVESDAPCWLIWQMQDINTPFVCFEPWYGLPDNEGSYTELSKRPFIQQAPAFGTWHGGFSVTVSA